VLDMAGKSRSYRKNLDFIAKDIGKDLIPFLSKEEMLKQMTPEDIVGAVTLEKLARAMTLEERLRGLDAEDILHGLDSETREKLKQLLNNRAE